MCVRTFVGFLKAMLIFELCQWLWYYVRTTPHIYTLESFFGFESVVESCGGGDDYIAHCIHFHVVVVDNLSGG